MTTAFFAWRNQIAPFRLYCYPPSDERTKCILLVFGNPNPRIKKSSTTVDEVYIYNTVTQFSCPPENAEMYLFDIPMGTKRRSGGWSGPKKEYVENQLRSYGPYFCRKFGSDHTILSSNEMTTFYLSHYSFPSTNLIYFVDSYYAYRRNPYIREMVHYPQMTCCTNLPLEDRRGINWNKFLIFLGTLTMGYLPATQLRHRIRDDFFNVSQHPYMLFGDLGSRDLPTNNKNFQRKNTYLDYVVGMSPHGDSPIRKAIFDMINSCCIPLIIADDLTLPFEGLFFEVNAVLVSVKENCVGDIARTLCLINEEKISWYRENILEMRRLYDRDYFGKFVLGNEEWA